MGAARRCEEQKDVDRPADLCECQNIRLVRFFFNCPPVLDSDNSPSGSAFYDAVEVNGIIIIV